MTSNDEKRQIVVQTMLSWRGRFKYTNDRRRENPEKYTWGDCSSVINAAYSRVGIWCGERSFNMAVNGVGVATARSIRHIDPSVLKPGDVICMGWPSVYGGRISHVEMYVGVIDGRHVTIGHGGPGPGPNIHDLYDRALTGSATIVMVRRFIYGDGGHATMPSVENEEENELNKLEKGQLAHLVEFADVVAIPALTQMNETLWKITQQLDIIAARLTPPVGDLDGKEKK